MFVSPLRGVMEGIMIEFQLLANKYQQLFKQECDQSKVAKIKRTLTNKNGTLIALSSPLGVQLEITSACNLRCHHCYNASSERDIQELTDEEWIKISKEIFTRKVMGLTISGGEPLIRKDLVKEIIEIANFNSVNSIGIITNGWLVDENFVEFLSQIKGSRIWVQVSIDGNCAEMHDWMRNKAGSWEKAINAVRLLKSQNVRVRIAHVCNRNNYTELWKMVELSILLGADEFVFTPVLTSGRAYHNKEALIMNSNEMKEFEETALTVQDLYKDKIRILRGSDYISYYSWSYLLPTLAALIRPNGNFKIDCSLPCVFGNLKEKSFYEIWTSKANIGWQHATVTDCMADYVNGTKGFIPYVRVCENY